MVTCGAAQDLETGGVRTQEARLGSPGLWGGQRNPLLQLDIGYSFLSLSLSFPLCGDGEDDGWPGFVGTNCTRLSN